MEEIIQTTTEQPEAASAIKKKTARKPSPVRSEQRPEPAEMTIFEQLFHIQQRLKVGKTEKNESEGFPYRTEEAILAAVTPLLGEVRCVLYFRDEILDVCPNYVYLKTTCVLANALGEVIEIPGFARSDAFLPGRCQAQIDGAASTYAHKYALKSLFGLAGENVKPERDPDAEAPVREEPAGQTEKTESDTRKEEPAAAPAAPAGLVRETPKSLPLLTPSSRNWNKTVMTVAKQRSGLSREKYAEWIRKTYTVSDGDLDLLLRMAGKMR